jgi:membrane associated rhomboid family serine protease
MSTTDGQVATCAQCGAVFASAPGETPALCPECAAKVAPARQSRWAYYSRGKISLALVGICVAAYLATLATGGTLASSDPSKLVQWGANFAPESLGREPWRLVTSMFLHGSIYHLLFNMWALLELGTLTEMIFGRARYAAIYFLAGIGGNLASCWWHPLQPGIGASGAIFGVAGALLIAFWLGQLPLEKKALTRMTANLAVVIVGNLLFGALVPAIDNTAHVGGLAVGVLITLVLVWRRRDARAPQALGWLVFPLVALGLTGAAFAARHANQYIFQAEDAEEKIEAHQPDAAIAELLPIVRAHPDLIYAQELLGKAYLDKHDAAAAVAPLEIAYRAHPDDESVLVGLGVAYLGTNRTDDAIELLRTAMRIEPNDADAPYDLGLAYEKKGDRAAALEMYKRALRLDPQNRAYQEAVERVTAR